jgi:hypothetical protein
MKSWILALLGTGFFLTPGVAFAQSNNETQANSYDNAWKSAWVNHCRSIYTATGKTAGFVLEIGDSITWSTAYAEWPRQGTSSATSDSPDDAAIFTWAMTTAWTGTSTDTTSKNGWFLSSENTTADRSVTAAGGITAVEYVSGTGNFGSSTAMPTDSTQAAAATDLVNTSIVYNLQINTVAAAFGDAQAAVVMLGTNDANQADGTTAYAAALTSIVGALEAQNIVVILSTIPPSTKVDVTPYNAQIRGYAQSHGLPLIDFYEEILARQPTNWSTTLISSDGIHPTGSGTGTSGTAWTSSSDPYAQGGNPATNATGEACTVVGYLLRSWLTVQKLKEVLSFVVQGNNPPAPPPPPPVSGKSGGCGATGLETLLVLGLVHALRQRGVR